jgi:hypothetical protein
VSWFSINLTLDCRIIDLPLFRQTFSLFFFRSFLLIFRLSLDLLKILCSRFLMVCLTNLSLMTASISFFQSDSVDQRFPKAFFSFLRGCISREEMEKKWTTGRRKNPKARASWQTPKRKKLIATGRGRMLNRLTEREAQQSAVLLALS